MAPERRLGDRRRNAPINTPSASRCAPRSRSTRPPRAASPPRSRACAPERPPLLRTSASTTWKRSSPFSIARFASRARVGASPLRAPRPRASRSRRLDRAGARNRAIHLTNVQTEEHVVGSAVAAAFRFERRDVDLVELRRACRLPACERNARGRLLCVPGERRRHDDGSCIRGPWWRVEIVRPVRSHRGPRIRRLGQRRGARRR